MAWYFLIFGIEIVIYLLFYRAKWSERINNRHIWYLGLSFAILFIFSSFRAPHVGTDFHSYITALDYVKKTGTYYMESGYIWLNKIILLFTDHHFGIAIAVNLMVMVPMIAMIIQCVDSKYWPICVMIFALQPYMYLQSTFNIMRQGCATGMIIIAVLLLRDKRYWTKALGVLFIILAAQFHRMAYSMLVLIPILLIKWKKQHWIAIGTAAFLINMCGIDLFSLAIQLISEKYVDYESSLLNIGLYAIFIYAVILGICYYYGRLCTNPKEKLFIDIYLFSLSYLLIALPNDIAYRIYIMLAFVTIPAVPVIWRKLGTLKLTDLPYVGNVRFRDKLQFMNKLCLVKIGYTGYYFSFFICYIFYLWLTNNTKYIPFSFGF